MSLLLENKDLPRTVNINTTSSVILTKEGAETLNRFNKQFHDLRPGFDKNEEYFPTSYKDGDEYKTELHQLFYIFGKSLTMGYNTPFLHNEIKLIKL